MEQPDKKETDAKVSLSTTSRLKQIIGVCRTAAVWTFRKGRRAVKKDPINVFLSIAAVCISIAAIFISVIAIIIGVWLGLPGYELAKEGLRDIEIPLYEYVPSKEGNAFEIVSKSNHEITDVKWILNLSEGGLGSGEDKRTLSVNDMLYHLMWDYESFSGSSSGGEKFAKCNIVWMLEVDRQKGFPMTTKVEFRQKNSREVEKSVDLLFARDVDTDKPWIDVYKRDVSENESNAFMKEQAQRLQQIYEFMTRKNRPPLATSEGKCLLSRGL
ncbi:MAG TPA: hypothetical protein VE422_30475 [Terriglobia bacterium]|nr:hypothetical protein [Terriglobia bacterium]